MGSKSGVVHKHVWQYEQKERKLVSSDIRIANSGLADNTMFAKLVSPKGVGRETNNLLWQVVVLSSAFATCLALREPWYWFQFCQAQLTCISTALLRMLHVLVHLLYMM